jgi:hypothetical protein
MLGTAKELQNLLGGQGRQSIDAPVFSLRRDA